MKRLVYVQVVRGGRTLKTLVDPNFRKGAAIAGGKEGRDGKGKAKVRR